MMEGRVRYKDEKHYQTQLSLIRRFEYESREEHTL